MDVCRLLAPQLLKTATLTFEPGCAISEELLSCGVQIVKVLIHSLWTFLGGAVAAGDPVANGDPVTGTNIFPRSLHTLAQLTSGVVGVCVGNSVGGSVGVLVGDGVGISVGRIVAEGSGVLGSWVLKWQQISCTSDARDQQGVVPGAGPALLEQVTCVYVASQQVLPAAFLPVAQHVSHGYLHGKQSMLRRESAHEGKGGQHANVRGVEASRVLRTGCSHRRNDRGWGARGGSIAAGLLHHATEVITVIIGHLIDETDLCVYARPT